MNKRVFRIKKRSRDTHKGNYGHVLIIAGSPRMMGAAYLSCEASLLSGAGLVTLALPKSLNAIMHRRLVEVMTLPLPETKGLSLATAASNKIIDFAKKADSVLIGPGLGQDSQTQKMILTLIRKIRLPMVIDADALNAVANSKVLHNTKKTTGIQLLLKGTFDKPIIITPHPGEMKKLTGLDTYFINRNKKNVAKKFSREYNVTTVLKGYRTVVASPAGRTYINKTGNPGMATAGCGDVLAGMIAALTASGMEAFKAARLGVYVHGLAGDIAAENKGEISLRARDILNFLPEAFKKVYG
jgi:ADP-dependent NAD(P)H-hydrate dehydratase / NAD(P)H-hydrate epimerase